MKKALEQTTNKINEMYNGGNSNDNTMNNGGSNLLNNISNMNINDDNENN